MYIENIPDNLQNENDQILIRLDTQIIDNKAAAISGSTPSVSAVARFGVHEVSKQINLRVQTPTLTNTMTFSTYAGDAYDIFTVTATVKHATTSTSAAYDVLAFFPLPPFFHLVDQTLTLNVTTDYTPTINPGLSESRGYILSGSIATDASVQIHIPIFPRGATLTTTFQLIVDEHASADYDIILPINVVSYSAPLATEVNNRNYSNPISRTFMVNEPNITTIVYNTSLPETTGSTVNIGEQAVYRSTITLPVSLLLFFIFFIFYFFIYSFF